MTIDYAAGGQLLEAFGRAWAMFDGDAWVDLFTPEAVYHGDPFSTPLVGDLALRRFLVASAETQEQVEFTVERHWVAGDTVLAAYHAGYVERTTHLRRRFAGFMTMDVAADGRIERLHEYRMVRPSTTSGQED